MNWMLPENVSSYGGEIDFLYYLILAITGVVFVVVQAALIFMLVRYRQREGRKAEYITGSTRAEVIWTTIPFVILVLLALISRNVWLDIKDPDRFPQNALEVKVEAKQFEWNFTYPGPDGVLGTADDFVVRNRMNMPVDQPVVVHLTADDVIHSFFLHEFRVKQDAVPGMEIPIWFAATRTGEFTLGCAELCGIGHYRMRGTVIVQTAAEFEEWHAEEAASALASAP